MTTQELRRLGVLPYEDTPNRVNRPWETGDTLRLPTERERFPWETEDVPTIDHETLERFRETARHAVETQFTFPDEPVIPNRNLWQVNWIRRLFDRVYGDGDV